jgi:uncharacterized protein
MVLAKAPAPGRVKTRLCPPFEPEQAARLAEAALVDTLRAVAATPCRRRVLVLDGAAGAWLPAGFDVVPQRGDGLDERLAHAFADADGGCGLLIGMDTPQVTPVQLAASLRALQRPGVDAVLGPAVDGGWWAIGLRASNPAVFLGVPMSTAHTGAAQWARMNRLGMRTGALTVMRDVDDVDDAVAVARAAPHSRFAATLRPILARLHAADAELAAL